MAVWKGIWKVNFGRVVTYSELAQNVDKRNACRAVGAACGMCVFAFVWCGCDVCDVCERLLGYVSTCVCAVIRVNHIAV